MRHRQVAASLVLDALKEKREWISKKIELGEPIHSQNLNTKGKQKVLEYYQKLENLAKYSEKMKKTVEKPDKE